MNETEVEVLTRGLKSLIVYLGLMVEERVPWNQRLLDEAIEISDWWENFER